MRELHPVYSHFRFVEECYDYETAEKFVKFWESMIDSLSKTHKVYVRRTPEIIENRRFEDNDTSYVASVRFSVGPVQEGEYPGKVQASYAYDNNNLTAPFGFSK